mmetsp:Transcript_13598/g.24491  ORF Transcript_13598/g.24491 Transcript_13598/m.24491 type:complete len:215 (-) Transcript_13598:23-667(-)
MAAMLRMSPSPLRGQQKKRLPKPRRKRSPRSRWWRQLSLPGALLQRLGAKLRRKRRPQPLAKRLRSRRSRTGRSRRRLYDQSQHSKSNSRSNSRSNSKSNSTSRRVRKGRKSSAASSFGSRPPRRSLSLVAAASATCLAAACRILLQTTLMRTTCRRRHGSTPTPATHSMASLLPRLCKDPPAELPSGCLAMPWLKARSLPDTCGGCAESTKAC